MDLGNQLRKNPHLAPLVVLEHIFTEPSPKLAQQNAIIVRNQEILLRHAQGEWTPLLSVRGGSGGTIDTSNEVVGAYDGAKRRKGSKTHMAVDTLGHLLALLVTPANEQDRAQVGPLAQAVQSATGESVALAYVDQGYTGDDAAQAAQAYGMQLLVMRLPEAQKGFVLLPKRWVVERSFGWMTRFRRLARDYERLPDTLKGLHFLAFAMLMAQRFIQAMPFCL